MGPTAINARLHASITSRVHTSFTAATGGSYDKNTSEEGPGAGEHIRNAKGAIGTPQGADSLQGYTNQRWPHSWAFLIPEAEYSSVIYTTVGC